MKTLGILTLISCLLFGLTLAETTGPYETVKAELGSAACVRIEFVSILHSEVFDVVDSVFGVADIARDGRFAIRVGSDEILFDGEHLYTYAPSSNQVIIEQPDDNLFAGSEIAVVTRLDEFYAATPLAPGKTYRLARKSPGHSELPDTLTLSLTDDGAALEQFDFRDINDDRNVIRILEQVTSDGCRDSLFLPSFPDSAERVKL